MTAPRGVWAVLALIVAAGALIAAAAGWTAEQIGNAAVVTVLIVAALWLLGIGQRKSRL